MTKGLLAQVSRGVCAGLTVCSMLGCIDSRDSHRQGSSAQTPFAQGYTAPPPTPTPLMWPSFSAEGYRRFEGRRLSPADTALIRKTLARVKPCQRATLRFAFTSDPNPQFVLFFDNPKQIWPHALWNRNLYFHRDDGSVIAAPPDDSVLPGNSIRYNIEHQLC